jgi:5-methylcytosine-specific restriction endonuclease McrA
MFGFDDPFGTDGKNSGRDKRRAFTQSQKKEIQYQQGGKCAACKKPLDPRDIEYDHKKPWADKGHTVSENGRALCGSCHNKVTHAHNLSKVDGRKKPVAKKPAAKKKATAKRKKTPSNPLDISLPTPKIPGLKMPRGKGGFGLF